MLKRLFRWFVPALISLLFLACGSALPSEGETPGAEATSHKDASRCERAFIWRATSTDAPGKVVHFLGSVHMADESFYPLDSVMEEAYVDSDKLVVEIDMASRDQAQMAAAMLLVAVAEDMPLNEAVSPETWQKVVAFLEENGLPQETVVGFKPWFAALSLVMVRLAKDGLEAEKGIDLYFLSKKQKPVLELETPEFQIGLFDGMSPELQELMLLDAVSGELQTGPDSNSMFQAWKEGDGERLDEILTSFVDENPAFEPFFHKLITERNRTMAQRLDEILQSEDKLLVVVGAGHVVGRGGLVDLFRKRGWMVEQLSCQGSAR